MKKPAEVASGYLSIGRSKVSAPLYKSFILGILAGAFIALAGIGSQVASATLTGSIGKVLAAAVFPAGLAMVLIAGSELFTGNCLLIMPLMKKEVKWGRTLAALGVVYLGNFIGAGLVAALVVLGGTPSLFSGTLASAIVSTASAKVSLTFIEAVARGVLCNFLVCIAVWMSFSAETVSGKIAALFFPIFLFVCCGFEHVVANMYYIPAGLLSAEKYGITAEALTVGAYFINNLLPVTLGNVIGGAAFVGVPYASVYLSKKEEK